MMIRSVITSVSVNTVNTVSVSEHSPRNVQIGAQFKSQTIPHWNTVAKKKARLHATMIPIMTQHHIANQRTAPKMRFQSRRMEILMRPKAIFSVVWMPYLIYSRCFISPYLFSNRGVQLDQSVYVDIDANIPVAHVLL